VAGVDDALIWVQSEQKDIEPDDKATQSVVIEFQSGHLGIMLHNPNQ